MEPIFLRPGEGEQGVRDQPQREIRILAGLDELAVTWSRYAEGESGPEPHIHRRHSDAFYVLGGRLEFQVGPERERVSGPAGTFAMAPPHLVHTFRNPGPGEAQFLNFHAPSMNFHRMLRDEHVDFDTEDPPEGGGRPRSKAVLHQPGEGRVIRLGPTEGAIMAGSGDGEGHLTLNESTLAPGFPGPVPHRHREMIDSFWVLEGTLALRLGDDTLEAEPGSFALVPPGTVHTFSNPGDAPVRVLNLMIPAGFERYLEEMAEEAARAGGPPDPARMAEIASRYDFEPVPG